MVKELDARFRGHERIITLQGMTMPPDLPIETWAQIRHDYEHTETPVEDICAEHGIASSTLRNRMRRWNWARRRSAIPAEGPPPQPAPRIEHPAPLVLAVPQMEKAAPTLPAAPQIDLAPPRVPAATQAAPAEEASALDEPASIVPRLQNAVGRVLPAIEAIVVKLGTGSTPPREMERAARALASLTRTLRELNTLLSQHRAPAAYDDDMPEDIDAFRLDFARRIELFVASRTGEASGAEPPET
jgi:hypothetical protein